MRWQVKAAIQWVLAAVPGGEKVNYGLQRLRGAYTGAGAGRSAALLAERMKALDAQRSLAGATVVEVGTGWSGRCALWLCLMGARRVVTFDHVRHLRMRNLGMQVAAVRDRLGELAGLLGVEEAELAKRLAPFVDCRTLEDLKGTPIEYVAPGDATETHLPDASVDVYYSHGVLEHVPAEAIAGMLREAHRVLKPGGVAYHHIALGDHWAQADRRIGQVNFLKYSEGFWKFIQDNKISYQNRLRLPEYLELFEQHGAEATILAQTVNEQDIERLETMEIDGRFRRFSPEELAVSGATIVLRFVPSERPGERAGAAGSEGQYVSDVAPAEAASASPAGKRGAGESAEAAER
jgi:SAM-dependent methyltransferase